MSSRPLALVLSLGLIFTPILVHASTCSNLADTIHNDIGQHPHDLSTQYFDWMQLDWLQKTLGAASPHKLAPGQLQYHWQCAEKNSAITLLTDTTGKIIKIKGEYNDHLHGASFYMACIK